MTPAESTAAARALANRWKIDAALIVSIVTFVISQALGIYFFTQTLKATHQALEVSEKIERIKLLRELTGKFYEEDPKLFAVIRGTIEACQKLYKPWGGRFTHDEINRYLGFYDDIGYYVKDGVLELRSVNQLFGALIVETHENNEIREYIDKTRIGAKQPESFAGFIWLATELEKISEHAPLIEQARRGCVPAQPPPAQSAATMVDGTKKRTAK